MLTNIKNGAKLFCTIAFFIILFTIFAVIDPGIVTMYD